MITIIIPTRNRAYTLARVAASYYSQNFVNEIIFVDDGGDDDSEAVIRKVARAFPHIATKYLKHIERRGAAAARITGYTNASNEYVLFGEDDAYLEKNYAKTLYEKLVSNNSVGIISGRIIYMRPGETVEQAGKRFGYGTEKKSYLKKISFAINTEAVFQADLSVPFTHAIFLTSISLLKCYGYDPYYAKGNGYREETDFQVNAFIHNRSIIVTNAVRCFHLHPREVRIGGQRVNRFRQLYWNTRYTNYFYDKYYVQLQARLRLPYPKSLAKVFFSVYQTYILFVQPIRKIPGLILDGLRR